MGLRRKLVAGLGAVVLVSAVSATFAPRAEASGIITHSWMTASAIPLVSDPDLRALLRANAADVEGGAHFPDSGYAAGVVGVENDYGEEAHWPRWHNAVARRIADQCDLDTVSTVCGRRIAHLFGSVGHGLGDQVWDWLFEPNAPDRGESYVPPDLEGRFSTGGLEMQMDLIAIGDYDRRTSPDLAAWPAPAGLAQAFADVGRPDVSTEDMDIGRTAINVARRGERALTERYRADITRNMRWTSSHLVTAPGGIRFAARAIAAAWDDLWARMQGEQPATEVSVTYPADGETHVPATGWERDEFLPGSAPDRGGARNRITAVLDAPLPHLLMAGPGDVDEQLPAGSMTLTEVGGDPVPLGEGWPRQVPYGGESGEHVVDLQPAEDLQTCTEYRVDVTDALLDLDEQPVTPYAWTFTTDGCSAPEDQPDLSAKRGATGALVGDDVHGASGAGQTRLLRAPRGGQATFYVRIDNDGNRPDRYRITGQRAVPGFGVRYFEGPTNVTARVVAGTYRTPLLAPGGARNLRVVVTVGARAPAGASVTRLVTARSANDHAVVDGVKLTVRRAAARARSEAAPVELLTTEELAEAARAAQVCLLD